MDETITGMDETIVWLEHFGPGLVPVLLTVALLAGASVAVALVKRLLRNWLKKFELHSSLSYETALTITRVATAALWVVVVTLALEVWGIGLGGIWTVVVSLVTVIGVGFLATWTMVSNVTASFFIAIWRPFHLGDTVEVLPENLKGRVIDSNLMFVSMREDSGAVIQIPNNLFFQKMFRSPVAAVGLSLKPHDARVVGPTNG